MLLRRAFGCWDGLDICIRHLCRISCDSSLCTDQCNKFCIDSGEGYFVGWSLPRGSICHRSPVLPPELFNHISNSSGVQAWSGQLHCKLHTLREMMNHKERCEKQPADLRFRTLLKPKHRFFHLQKMKTWGTVDSSWCFHEFISLTSVLTSFTNSYAGLTVSD